MPKQLSDERIALVLLPAPPADKDAITVAEFDAGIRLECRIMAGEYRLTPVASDTTNQSEMCEANNAMVPTRDNFEGTMTVFRYLTGAGVADALNDVAWDAVKEKGALLPLVEREGPEHDLDGAVGQEYSYFEVLNDNPQAPSDRTGYIRRVVPLYVQRAALNKELVTA